MRLILSVVVFCFVAVMPAPALGQTPDQDPAAIELVLSGPQKPPLHTQGKAIHFTATVINHSSSAILLVPPHPDWPEERWTTWHATDEHARQVDNLPQELIWCDPQGEMHGQPVFPGNVIGLLNLPSKAIRDSDLVLLQPGESYQLPHIGDPRFYVKFLHRGQYRLSLTYDFQPAHYRLSRSSGHFEALQHAVPLSLVSNSIELTLE